MGRPSPLPILFVHSSDELYGSDIVLLELVRRLDRERFHPVVITPTDIGYRGLLSQALADAGVKHVAVDMPVLRRRYLSPSGLPGFLRRFPGGVRRVQQVIEGEQIALVHSNTSAVLAGAFAARRAGVPHVWHVHELVTRPAFVRKLIAFLLNRYSDKVVAISQAVANHLLQDQPGLSARLCVVHDAVDTERFHPRNDGGALRRRWGVGEQDVLAGVVGRISSWKGQSFFLEAFARALPQAPNLFGVIVGDVVPGEEWRRSELEQQLEQTGISERVALPGYCNDAPSVMAALDILVLPSTLPEPFGMVVIEAMASGKPVIATAHGGPLETVVPEETGLFVPCNDVESLANALVRLASSPDLRTRLGRNGRMHVLEKFSFDQHLTAFAEIYTQLLSSS